jgi:drug/metabolite transporter (DMT)-like permease
VARRSRIDAAGATALVTFSMLLGLNQVLIKIVNIGIQPAFQSGLRSATAFVPVLLYSLATRKRLSVTDGSLWPGIACGACFAVEFLLLFHSLDYTSVSRASIFFYTMPFWVAAAAHFLIPGERLTPVRLIGLGCAIAGVAWALLQGGGPDPAQSFIGDVMSLLAAVLWAAIPIIIRTTRLAKSTPEMQLLYQLGVSAPLMIAAAVFLGDLIREPNAVTWMIFAFQSLVIVAVGFLAWFHILSIYPASDMASFAFLAPLFSVFFSWTILGENISLSFLGALALVCFGIVLINRRGTA